MNSFKKLHQWLIIYIRAHSKSSKKIKKIKKNIEPVSDIKTEAKIITKKDWFPIALRHILKAEGGYVNDPDDPGGATNKGITQKTYNRWLTDNEIQPQDVRHIPYINVYNIYRERYWSKSSADVICDELNKPDLAIMLFDSAVNCGTKQSIKFLQRAVGARDDGYYGEKTHALVKATSEWYTIESLINHRMVYYDKIIKRNPRLEKFRRGWTIRVDRLEAELLSDETS